MKLVEVLVAECARSRSVSGPTAAPVKLGARQNATRDWVPRLVDGEHAGVAMRLRFLAADPEQARFHAQGAFTHTGCLCCQGPATETARFDMRDGMRPFYEKNQAALPKPSSRTRCRAFEHPRSLRTDMPSLPWTCRLPRIGKKRSMSKPPREPHRVHFGHQLLHPAQPLCRLKTQN